MEEGVGDTDWHVFKRVERCFDTITMVGQHGAYELGSEMMCACAV